jgi:hypothetical protein
MYRRDRGFLSENDRFLIPSSKLRPLLCEESKNATSGDARSLFEIAISVLRSGFGMATANSDKCNLASMGDTIQTLSPCLRLLIEILLDETTTTKTEMSLARKSCSEAIQTGVLTCERSVQP